MTKKNRLGMLLFVSVGCACATLICRGQNSAQDTDSRKAQTSEPLLVTFDSMLTLPGPPGELLHICEGKVHGFDSLSIIISETKAGSGAPSHRHKCEEAHVLLKGKVQYVVGDKTFIAEAPYVVRIPAGVNHSFKNIGTEPINVIGIFPKNQESEIDPNKTDRRPEN